MITIKTLENIRRGSRITLFNGIYASVIGLLYLVFIKFLTKTNFRAIDIVWQVFSRYNPKISSIIIRLMILKSILIISIGVTIVYLSFYILKKKDRNSWLTLFMLGIIFWPSLFVFEILDKNIYTIAATFIGWVSFIIGILIPIRYFMQKDYTEY